MQESRTWQEKDRSHHFHPFTDLQHYATAGGPIFSHAEHVFIRDTDGREILDGMSGLWCCNLGYSQTSIMTAIAEQLQKLPYYNSFFACSNDSAVTLASNLVAVTPKQFNHFFFTSSGSEANDTNIRLVHRYFDIIGKPDKKHIISRENAYHGSTIAAASLGGMSAMHKQFTSLPYVHHVKQPYWYKDGGDESPDEYGLTTALTLEQKIDELGEENVAAFIAEPIQGAGGVIVPPATYWPAVQKICNERDILFISDEVICGFGRTGKWFGCDTYETKPDLITFAKGVSNGYQPLGGVAISDTISDVLTSGGGEFTHGFTYSGHPVACAAGNATLDVFAEQNVIDYVASDIAPYFAQKVNSLADHPVVGEVRTTGMLAAFELVKNKTTKEKLAIDGGGAVYCRNSAIDNGLMVRTVGDSIISAPPLVCTHEDIDMLIERLVPALDRTAQEYGVS